MQFQDYIILAIIFTLVILAIRYTVHHKGGCGGSCENCSHCHSCQRGLPAEFAEKRNSEKKLPSSSSGRKSL